jgi:hypothetical protein
MELALELRRVAEAQVGDRELRVDQQNLHLTSSFLGGFL